MPAATASGSLEAVLAALARALDDSGAPWMVIRGVAVIAHGVRRLTTDVDAVVRGDAIRIDALVDVLARHDIEPRIENAIEFAQQNLVLLMRHRTTGVDLDVSLAWSSFELEALAAATLMPFGSVHVRMPTPSDLVVFKAIAGRPKDVEDAETLLVLHGDIDLARTRARVADLTALTDAPELLAAFDQLAARARRA